MSLIKKLINTLNNNKICYIAIDIHETFLKPSWKYEEDPKINFYPLSKKVLQLITKNKRIKTILWTSSYNNIINKYQKKLEKYNIKFDYINNNPECENNQFACFDNKFYFDVGLDDRCGFNPYYDWIILYIFFNYLIKFINYKK